MSGKMSCENFRYINFCEIIPNTSPPLFLVIVSNKILNKYLT